MPAFDTKNVHDRVFAKSGLDADQQASLIARYSHHDDQRSVDQAAITELARQVDTQEISEIPEGGLCIFESGHYRLTNDIIWKAGEEATAAICIFADDVTIDLNGFALHIEPWSLKSQIAAILVWDDKSDRQNVTIKNGNIINAGYRGIWAHGVSKLTIEDLLISGLTFNDLDTRTAFPAGIYINQCADVTISSATVQYGYVTADVAAGIVLMKSLGAAVTDCNISNFTNNDGSMQGYAAYESKSILWTGCSVEQLQSFFHANIRTGGHTAIGFMPCICAELEIIDCSARNIIGSRDDCHGMSIFICAEAKASGFFADTVVDGPAPYHIGAKATGLEVYGWGVTVENCEVSNIFANCPQDRQSAGFAMWGSDINVKGCVANNVQVFDAQGEPSTEHGLGVGFGWAPDPRPEFCHTPAEKVLYEACVAQEC